MPPTPRPTPFTHALAMNAAEGVVFGMSFAPPAVLQALGGSEDAAIALPAACERLELDFVFVEGGDAALFDAVAAAGCSPVAVIDGPFGKTLDCVGWKNGLLATVQDPPSLERLLHEAEQESVAGIEAAAESGAVAIVIAEDLAGSTGPFVAPDFVFAEVVPRVRTLVSAAAAFGLPAIVHSDGDVRAFVPAIARAGAVGIHGGGGLEEARHDAVVAAVRKAGMVFLGGITADIEGPPMRAVAVGSRAGVLALGGGVLVCDDGGLSTHAAGIAFVTALAAAREATGRQRSGG